jgi:hypothetical protein
MKTIPIIHTICLDHYASHAIASGQGGGNEYRGDYHIGGIDCHINRQSDYLEEEVVQKAIDAATASRGW